jgi:uncharacterized cupredoxin-like copper-binding protein
MVVFVGGVWLLVIPFSPAPILETGTVLPLYRAMGIMPEIGKTTISTAIAHDVFEVPEEDAEHLKMAMKDMGDMKVEGMEMKDMPGMKTEGMKMKDMPEMKKADADGMKMAMKDTGDMKMEGMKMKDMPEMKKEAADGMKMAMKDTGDMKMEGMKMKDMPEMKKEAGEAREEEKGEHGKEGEEARGEEEEGGHGGGSVAEGLTVIAQGSAADIGRELAEQGLKVDATVNIDMKEWSYGNSMIMAQPGQVIRLKVKNTGNIPHEFMIMSGAAMQAVNYRLTRPDWNLLEHKALSEVSFVLPGDGFEMVVQIHKSGSWMFMCMFPYHMQLGMMGMLMTPDMMGKMGSMAGMKM